MTDIQLPLATTLHQRALGAGGDPRTPEQRCADNLKAQVKPILEQAADTGEFKRMMTVPELFALVPPQPSWTENDCMTVVVATFAAEGIRLYKGTTALGSTAVVFSWLDGDAE